MVLNLAAGEVLRDFPARLPEGLREPLGRDMLKVGRMLTEAVSEIGVGVEAEERARMLDQELSRVEAEIEAESKKGKVKTTSAELDQMDTEGRIFVHVLFMFIALSLLDISPHDLDFNRLLCSQQLVMVLAHLDAFMADSLRAICRVRPEVLMSEKKLEWSTLISCGGWDELLAHLIEQYVFEFGWRSIYKRVQFLKEQLGLVIDFPESDIELLEEAENIRNIIVHNGGRVSQEYIARTGRDDLRIGDFVPVTLEYVDEVSMAASTLAGELFVEVSRKFFGIEESEISGVLRRGQEESTSKQDGA
jgi:hypothetical protein